MTDYCYDTLTTLPAAAPWLYRCMSPCAKICIRRESNPELGHGKTQCYRYTTNACRKLLHILPQRGYATFVIWVLTQTTVCDYLYNGLWMTYRPTKTQGLQDSAMSCGIRGAGVNANAVLNRLGNMNGSRPSSESGTCWQGVLIQLLTAFFPLTVNSPTARNLYSPSNGALVSWKLAYRSTNRLTYVS